MARELVFGIRLRADGSGFVGEVRASGEALKGLARDARQAQQEVERAGDDMGRTLGRATAIGATIGTVLGQAIVGIGRRIFEMTRESIDALDDLKDAAQGLALAPEVLSSMEISAQAAGVGAGQLSTALAQLNRRMADAVAGGQRSKAIFDALGISLLGANGQMRSTEEVLGDVADRFRTYADGAKESAIAQELFGRSGAKLVAFLNEGREGLTKFEGASRDSIEQAAKLKDEIDKLAASWERFKFLLGGSIAGPIADVLDRINQLDFKKIGDAFDTFFLGNFGAAFAEYGRQLDEINRKQRQRVEALRLADGVYSNEGRGRASAAPDIDRPTRAPRAPRELDPRELELWEDLNAIIREDLALQQEVERAGERAAQMLAREDEARVRKLSSLAEENQRLRENVEEIGLSEFAVDALRTKRLEDAIATREQSLALQQLAGESEAEIARTQREIELLRERMSLQRQGAGRRAEAATAREVERAAQRSMEEQKEAAREVGRLLGDAMMRGFERGENVARNFVESLAHMIQTRLAQALAQAIVDSGIRELAGGLGSGGALDFIGDAFISIFGLHGGGVAGERPTFRRAVPAAAFAGAPRLHGGGVLPGEVPAILRRGEGVFTPEQMARLAPAGAGVTVNVINNAGAQVTTRERQDAGGITLDVLIEQVEGALAGNMSRGRGALNQALQARFGLRQRPG